MERMTERYGDIYVRLKRKTTTVPEAFELLASYEDTNLTPADINDLRNELCLKCGKYKDAHLGACDGCRWRKKETCNEPD